LLNPEDNNERQTIHEHVSAPLKPVQLPTVSQKKKSGGMGMPGLN
jgi:hypothetical protein